MDYLDSFFARRTDLENTFASIILTHPHVDHTRGVPAVIGKYKTRNAVTNGLETGSGKVGQIALPRRPPTAKPKGARNASGLWLCIDKTSRRVPD
jgi:phosphoribosyl 1,2-cyclic phosphodiesterase